MRYTRIPELRVKSMMCRKRNVADAARPPEIQPRVRSGSGPRSHRAGNRRNGRGARAHRSSRARRLQDLHPDRWRVHAEWHTTRLRVSGDRPNLLAAVAYRERPDSRKAFAASASADPHPGPTFGPAQAAL